MTDRSEQGQSFGRVIDVLEAIGALYAIWGGLAVIVYGEPRFTMDMDVLLSHHNFAAPLTPTTLVMANLQAYVDSSSTRHLDDIASIVRVQANNLDAAVIDVAAARLKIMGLWRALWEGNYPQS